MKIAVLIEPLNGTGFRATGGEPFSITAEGATREEALNALKEAMAMRLKCGAELVSLEVGPQEHPLLKYAGMYMYKEEPLFEEWKQAIEDYRNEIEKDDAYL